MTEQSPRRESEREREGFSLVELLVVIAIIAILIGILVPVVSSVRKAGREADVRQQISTLAGACEQYRLNYGAYPGPLHNNQIGTVATMLPAALTVTAATGFDSTTPINCPSVTMSENLVLGLLGGMTDASTYNPSLVGNGPKSLLVTNPKQYPASLGNANLSWRDVVTGKTGKYQDNMQQVASDTIIPEFVDRFPEAMPILYLRSRVGVAQVSTGATAAYNSVITNNTSGAGGFRYGPYDINQISAYTSSSIGVGRKFPTHGLQSVTLAAPFDPKIAMDAYPYFLHPTLPNTARQKDSFILISAGSDRVYGTGDDICSFGAVAR